MSRFYGSLFISISLFSGFYISLFQQKHGSDSKNGRND